jgi:limonene-1,2-epoxide hydrolase
MTTDAMTPSDTVTAFIAAIVAKDFARATELATEDIVYDNVPMPTVTGPAAMCDMLSPVEEAEWTVHRQIAVGDVVMNERTDRLKINGAWFELPVAGVFEVRDGRVALWRDYFDLQTMINGLSGPAA